MLTLIYSSVKLLQPKQGPLSIVEDEVQSLFQTLKAPENGSCGKTVSSSALYKLWIKLQASF